MARQRKCDCPIVSSLTARWTARAGPVESVTQRVINKACLICILSVSVCLSISSCVFVWTQTDTFTLFPLREQTHVYTKHQWVSPSSQSVSQAESWLTGHSVCREGSPGSCHTAAVTHLSPGATERKLLKRVCLCVCVCQKLEILLSKPLLHYTGMTSLLLCELCWHKGFTHLVVNAWHTGASSTCRLHHEFNWWWKSERIKMCQLLYVISLPFWMLGTFSFGVGLHSSLSYPDTKQSLIFSFWWENTTL